MIERIIMPVYYTRYYLVLVDVGVNLWLAVKSRLHERFTRIAVIYSCYGKDPKVQILLADHISIIANGPDCRGAKDELYVFYNLRITKYQNSCAEIKSCRGWKYLIIQKIPLFSPLIEYPPRVIKQCHLQQFGVSITWFVLYRTLVFY